MRNSFLLLTLFLFTLVSGCKKDEPELESGIYLGIIGFNDQLYESPVRHLNASSEYEFESFISGLASDDGTILYHAVNESLNKLGDACLPDDLESISIVTFTDGLDLGSYVLNDNYNSPSEYLSAVRSRIENDKIKNLDIQAYSIGVRGNDVVDEQQFIENLESLASSPGNVYALNNINEVEAIFRQIASSLTTESSSQSLDLTMAVPAPGVTVRFTFDISSGGSASSSNLYIEGVFNVQGDNYSLSNIVYQGIESSSGSVVNGSLSGVEATFSFQDIMRTDGYPFDISSVNQWTYIASSSQWQINSEFNPEDDIITEVEQKSTAIFLVLDCSSSLGSDFYGVQTAAISFINTLTGSSSNVGYACSGSSCYSSPNGPYNSEYECELYCGSPSNNGDLTFWTVYDPGCGFIDVSISGYGTQTISSYYSAGISSCGLSGCANFTNLPAGSYVYNYYCNGTPYSGTAIVTSNNCATVQLY